MRPMKKEYVKPHVGVYGMEVRTAILSGSLRPGVSESPASSEFEVLTGKNTFTDIWGN